MFSFLHPETTRTGSNVLPNYGELCHGGYLVSKNRHYYLVMQTDGNIVVYRSGDFNPRYATWSSNTNGKGSAPYRLVMQNDGNLVVYDSHNVPTWASNTQHKGNAPFRLEMQDDGNVVVYDSRNTPTWATNTNVSTPIHTPNSLSNEGVLAESEYVRALDNTCFLRMQSDGNLVLYTSTDWSPSQAVWASNSHGKGVGPYRCVMQHDGNLVIYDARNTPIWASNTNQQGTGPYRLVVQEDRNVVIYDATNTPIWSTNTNI